MTKNTSYSLIGYAYGGGGIIRGCKDGPDILRARGLLDRIRQLNLNLSDLGNISPKLSPDEEKKLLSQTTAEEQLVHNLAPTAESCRLLAEKTSQALRQNSVPIILGGDHSLSIGNVAATSNFYAEKNEAIGLIWIDTHADINTPHSSPSKNVFGMSVAVLLGLFPGILSRIQKATPAILPEHLVYIGLRDLEKAEKERIRTLGISAFTMKEIDLMGIAQVVNKAIEIAGGNTAGYVVSFDLDVCDPRLVPGTGTPCRGGLTYRESHLMMELIAEANRTLALEIVELNPSLDKDFKTAELAISLIESACGKTIL